MRYIGLVLVFFSFSFAHRLNLFTNYEKDTLYINSYFANSKPCISCELIIKNSKNKIVKKAKTNSKGEYTLVLALDDYSVIVDTKTGHKVSKTLRLKNKAILEDSKKVKSSQNIEFEKLKKENFSLKNENRLLKEKLEQQEIFKILFGLLLIIAIFFILKRIKK